MHLLDSSQKVRWGGNCTEKKTIRWKVENMSQICYVVEPPKVLIGNKLPRIISASPHRDTLLAVGGKGLARWMTYKGKFNTSSGRQENNKNKY